MCQVASKTFEKIKVWIEELNFYKSKLVIANKEIEKLNELSKLS